MFIYLLLFVAIVTVCFIFYLLSLMQLMPIYIAGPALFLAILFTIQLGLQGNRPSRSKQFKGFKN
ncbi:hypothetical protein [Lottiidibacillus patelloidae]|uniref:hypothetical protein n=1 Tax=Lottiidibacillus patelloidae TaxID=2670334 RepID=UPI001155163B|nr:hypothetical protein [Lottiidibacillus patelloidae]